MADQATPAAADESIARPSEIAAGDVIVVEMKMRLQLTLVCFALVLPAAAKPSLSLDRSVELPAAGIKLRPFDEARQTPLPAPRTWVYQNQATGEKISAYSPLDLWFRDQHCATFRSELAEIMVARLAFNLPARLPLLGQQHIREADYVKVRDQIEMKWDDDAEKRWLQTFGANVKEREDKVPGLWLRFKYVRLTFEDAPRERLQAFILRRRGDDDLFVVFKFPPGLKAKTADKAVRAVLRSIIKIRTRQTNKEASNRFQNRDARKRGERSEEYELTRKRVIAAIRNLKDWWYVETENYILKSNLDRRNRRLARQIQEDIEICRSAYEKFLPPIKTFDEVSVITIFNTRREYLNYVPQDRQWTAGLWLPSRKELVISPVDTGKRRLTREIILQTVYHEAFHQYIYYALDYTIPPTWFNEGHAMMFEAVELDHRKEVLEVEENEPRVKLLEKILEDNKVNLLPIMRLSGRQFYQEQSLAANYALSWGLVYFLRKAHPQYPEAGYDKVCNRVYQTLIKTRDWRKATEAGIAAVDTGRLHKDFLDFWSSNSKRRKAERYEIFREKR